MAKLAPACPARPCGLRRPDAALAPGDLPPRPSPTRNQTKSNQIKPNQTVPPHARTGWGRPVPTTISIGPAPPPWWPSARTRQNPSNRASSRQIKPHQGKRVKRRHHHPERQRRGPIPAQSNALGSSPFGTTALKERATPPIKAKTFVIVHHQGKSRHPPKNTQPLGAFLELGGWHWEFPRPIPFATLRLRAFALKTRHQGMIKAQSRQKPL